MLADFELAEVIWDVAEPGLSLEDRDTLCAAFHTCEPILAMCATLRAVHAPGSGRAVSCSPAAASRTQGCCWSHATGTRTGSAMTRTGWVAISWTIRARSSDGYTCAQGRQFHCCAAARWWMANSMEK